MTSLDRRLPPGFLEETLRADAAGGLTAEPKWLPPKWFYDAQGSALFDKITELPEYYPTRAEREILRATAAAIARQTRAQTLIELGSGSSDKTRLLLDALRTEGTLRGYVPVDVSEPALAAAGKALSAEYPGLDVRAVVSDFEERLGFPADDAAPAPRLVAFLGSTIGNLEPGQRAAFLARVRAQLGPDDFFLLGTDLVKDRAALVAAHLAAKDTPQVATGVPMAAAGPSTAHTEMRHYNHDAWSSVTDTILLPDQGAILGALAPVFVPSAPGERRAVTVFYPAMSQSKADKVTGREEMSAIVGSELRRRSGRIERARQRRATAKVSNIDEKLAKGRALVRPCAAATVTVPNTWPIAEFARRLDASIRLAGFIPQRLDGAQDAAFAAAAIPLGIGVPRRRGLR